MADERPEAPKPQTGGKPTPEEKEADLVNFIKKKTTIFDKALSALAHFDGRERKFNRDGFHRELIWRAIKTAEQEIERLKKRVAILQREKEERVEEAARLSGRRRAVKWIAAAVFLLALLASSSLWAPAAGKFLAYNSPLDKADLIYVLSSGAIVRAPHAARLLEGGWADRIMVSGQTKYTNLAAYGIQANDADYNAHLLENFGVDPKKIIKVDKGTSTAEELTNLKVLMRERGFHSVILVSSDFHMRRLRLVAPLILNEPGVKIIYSAAESKNFKLSRWWQTEEGLITVVNEYFKLGHYLVKYNILKRLPPDDYTAPETYY